jgi:hypothetical protein
VLLIILNFNKMRFNKYILSALVIFTLTSCEDVIEVDVEEGKVQLSVDAFLNNKNEVQKIKLLETKQFFSELEQPIYVADSVFVIDNLNNKYLFEDQEGNGVYEWSDSVLVHENRTYSLTIIKDADVFTSESVSSPVPTIDSINWEYQAVGFTAENGGYTAEMVARDLPGQIDYYKIEWAKDGVYVKGNAINISVDGSFSETGAVDSGLFIPPISTFAAFDPEDSLGTGVVFTYDLLSIQESTYNFWTEVMNQRIDDSLGALFATPTANVQSNIKSLDINKTAVGWFSVSMISSHSQLIYEKPGERVSFELNQ